MVGCGLSIPHHRLELSKRCLSAFRFRSLSNFWQIARRVSSIRGRSARVRRRSLGVRGRRVRKRTLHRHRRRRRRFSCAFNG